MELFFERIIGVISKTYGKETPEGILEQIVDDNRRGNPWKDPEEILRGFSEVVPGEIIKTI